MNREKIIEALSRNYASRFGGFGPTMEADIERVNKTWPRYVREMEATLTALETAIPSLADVIAGKAVVVPVEASGKMVDAGARYLRGSGMAMDCYTQARGTHAVMIEARPK